MLYFLKDLKTQTVVSLGLIFRLSEVMFVLFIKLYFFLNVFSFYLFDANSTEFIRFSCLSGLLFICLLIVAVAGFLFVCCYVVVFFSEFVGCSIAIDVSYHYYNKSLFILVFGFKVFRL